MILKDSTLDILNKSLKILKKIPCGVYFSFAYDGGLQIEARTQSEVREITRKFRGVIWKKNFVDYSEQWEYQTRTRDGVNVRIYGVKEGPAQCKMVKETVMEERSVPEHEVKYITKMVAVEKVRYICPDTDKAKN